MKLGGFDTSFYPGYFEDVDYNLRIREASHEIWFVPESKIIHLESASTSPQAKVLINQWSEQRYNAKWSFPLGVSDPDAPHAVQRGAFAAQGALDPGASETDLVLRELAFQRELTEGFLARIPALEQENLRLMQENLRARDRILLLEAEQNRLAYRFADAFARFFARIPLLGRAMKAIGRLVVPESQR
jgi:hypothetical protein